MITTAIENITYRSQIFPKEAFRVITENEEAAKPYLREALEKAIREKTELDGDYQLHFMRYFCWGSFRTRQHFKRSQNLYPSRRMWSII